MNEVYQESAYRSDAIPILPPGGHLDMDRAFQRLGWGYYQNPVAPNTMEAQLAYASLFKEETDADDGFPWGESRFSVPKGMLSSIQSALYLIKMCGWVSTIIFGIIFLISMPVVWLANPDGDAFVVFLSAYGVIFMVIITVFLLAKYLRLFVAHCTNKLQRANPTGLYRREGLVRIKQRDGVIETPFIEFDAYLVHTPSGRGGRYFNLVLQHRYSKHQLWMKGLLTDAMDQREVHAYWDMIQQFMDVTQPLPDVPIFEPFRSRDPVTRDWDERTGRDPFKWRKITPESWRENHEQTYRERLRNTYFHHPCILDAHIQGRGLPLPGEPHGAMLA